MIVQHGSFLAPLTRTEPKGSDQLNHVQTDHHRRIVDARLSPYRAVGKFHGTVDCTAAIVLDPRIIVTAAHCLTQTDGNLKLARLSFRPGYQGHSDLGLFDATVWAVGAAQSGRPQSSQTASNDWAVLVLDRTPGGIRPFAMGNYTVDDLRLLRGEIVLPSYSIDMAEANSLGIDPACSIRDMVWDILLHDCGASFGASGAPLLARYENWYVVTAINTGSVVTRDEARHTMTFVGNSAIGAWSFQAAVNALAHRLGGAKYVAHVRAPLSR
jgi:V8-like Glu-specific endopeptidase